MSSQSKSDVYVTEVSGTIEVQWKKGTRDDRPKVIRHSHRGTSSNAPMPWSIAGLILVFRALFLPEGYPDSVSADYTRYQVCDTVQALCSSVTGTLSTRAILKGVGVGEAEATALGGLAQWVVRDGIGMVGRIAFATRVSSDLDNDAKRWRLAADITNDIGLLLEILSTHVPPWCFLWLVCIANLFKAVTCVAGGTTRTSLTQHFAQRENLADVAAKDGSQETAVGLLGMFVGMFVAYVVPDTFAATLAVFSGFTALHLVSNYIAVKSLILNQLNEQRLLLCVDRLLDTDGAEVYTPQQCAALEPVVWSMRRPIDISVGASFQSAINRICRGHGTSVDIPATLAMLEKQRYFVVGDAAAKEAVVLLADGRRSTTGTSSSNDISGELLLTAYLEALRDYSPRHRDLNVPCVIQALLAAGWNTQRAQLRQRGWRVKVAP